MAEIESGVRKLAVSMGQPANTATAQRKADGPDMFNVRRRLSIAASTTDTAFELDGAGGGRVVESDRKVDGSSVSRTAPFVSFASLSEDGYIPFNSNKVNQDRAAATLSMYGLADRAYFGVYDGHGAAGHHVSTYVAAELPRHLSKHDADAEPIRALTQAFHDCQDALRTTDIDTNFSGTTAITCYFHGDAVYTANAGDSRAVLCQVRNGHPEAVPLSSDHKADRPDEKLRIIQRKGRVQACQGSDGVDIGPARVWLLRQDVPGLAMTRSFGDAVAASVGVICTPEITHRKLTDADKLIILASDGVWEFISSQEAVEMVWRCKTPEEACGVLVREAVKRWKREEEVIDDITALVIFLKP